MDKATTSIAIEVFLCSRHPISGIRVNYGGREWTRTIDLTDVNRLGRIPLGQLTTKHFGLYVPLVASW